MSMRKMLKNSFFPDRRQLLKRFYTVALSHIIPGRLDGFTEKLHCQNSLEYCQKGINLISCVHNFEWLCIYRTHIIKRERDRKGHQMDLPYWVTVPAFFLKFKLFRYLCPGGNEMRCPILLRLQSVLCQPAL